MNDCEKKELHVCTWYDRCAVYLDGELVHYGQGPWGWPLLTSLGYTVTHLPEIPSHGFPEEYDRESNGHWKPPMSLDVLLEQQQRVKNRHRRQRIQQMEETLAKLREEEKTENGGSETGK